MHIKYYLHKGISLPGCDRSGEKVKRRAATDTKRMGNALRQCDLLIYVGIIQDSYGIKKPMFLPDVN